MTRYCYLFLLFSFLQSLKAQEPFFIQHDLGDANLNLAINTLLQDRNSMIWIGTDDGLATFDGNVYYPIMIDTAELKTEVTALFEDDRGTIWVGTSSGKIFFLDHTRQPKSFDIQEGHPKKPITA
ncbi:MAG: two-component regulator propeller domain-containing protein, partial [Saprospiraceae bacterium]